VGGGSYRYLRVVYEQHIYAGYFGNLDFSCEEIRIFGC
jgi:hypothetical protein